MTKIILLLSLAVSAFAQNGQPVRIQDDPSTDAVQTVAILSGSNTVALCYALSSDYNRFARTVAISAVSKANPAVVTSVGHGFPTSARPSVTISGATGTGWTGINGTFVATVIDADTFSIPVDSTGFGTLGGTVVFGTSAPRTVVSEWAIKKFAYDGSGNFIWSGWINGITTYTQKCSNATVTTVSQQ